MTYLHKCVIFFYCIIMAASLVPGNYKVVEGASSSVALFQQIPTNTAVQNFKYIAHRPKSELSSSSSILEFTVDSANSYIDLSKTALYVKCKIVDSNNVAVPSGENVAIVNNSLGSIFNQVDVAIQGRPITKLATNVYCIKSYLDLILHSGDDKLETYAITRGYIKEPGEYMEDLYAVRPKELTDEEASKLHFYRNASLYERYKYTANGRSWEMEGPLNVDLFNTPHYLLSNTVLSVKLWPANDNFRIISPNVDRGYRVVIEDAHLKLAHVDLIPEIVFAHEESLAKSPALYPYYDSVFKIGTASKDNSSFSCDNLFSSTVPSKIFVMLVSAEAYNGNYRMNPFFFTHANIASMNLRVDGYSLPAGKPYQTDFASNQCIEPYANLFKVLKFWGRNESCDIPFQDFMNGYTIFAFDTDSHDFSQNFLPGFKTGLVSLDISFAKPLPCAMTVIAYGRIPKCLSIDKARNVIL